MRQNRFEKGLLWKTDKPDPLGLVQWLVIVLALLGVWIAFLYGMLADAEGEVQRAKQAQNSAEHNLLALLNELPVVDERNGVTVIAKIETITTGDR